MNKHGNIYIYSLVYPDRFWCTLLLIGFLITTRRNMALHKDKIGREEICYKNTLLVVVLYHD